MKSVIAVTLYLLFVPVIANAADIVAQSRGECLRQLSTLGKLIENHNPSERHISTLRKQAGKVSVLCQRGQYSFAYDLLSEMKRSVSAVNNPAKTPVHDNTIRTSIQKCLGELNAHKKDIDLGSLKEEDERRLKAASAQMRKNCLLQQFGKAVKDHKKLLHILARIKQDRLDLHANFDSLMGCHSKIRNLNKRLNTDKITGRVRVWIRKNTNEIYGLCEKKKYTRAETQYRSVLKDYAAFIKKETNEAARRKAERHNAQNCHLAYTYLFQAINKAPISEAERKKLRRKRSDLSAYCFEKDYSNAKKLFRDLIATLETQKP